MKTPSLADRIVAHGGIASALKACMDEQRARATASSSLEARGAGRRHPPRVQLRAGTLRFSAALDATAISLLERDSAVQGVYPVRVAYPASVSSDALERRALASSVGNADLSLSGYDGRAVTIALLDTGVDRLHPSLVGSVSRGVADGPQ